MSIVAIIQARVDSTRLLGKVLKKIEGRAILEHVVNRVKAAKKLDEVLVATTIKKGDLEVVKLCARLGVSIFCGSEDDVLDRYYRAAKKYGSDIIVRITADCPLIDPGVTDKVINCFVKNNFDFVSNAHPPTYPDGLDIGVFSFKALKKIWKKARKLSEREHVIPYFLNHPENFKIGNVENAKNLSHMRWVVDEEKDLEFVKAIYKRLYKNNEIFYMEDILDLLEKEPQLSQINADISRNEGYIRSLKEDKVLNLDCLEE